MAVGGRVLCLSGWTTEKYFLSFFHCNAFKYLRKKTLCANFLLCTWSVCVCVLICIYVCGLCVCGSVVCVHMCFYNPYVASSIFYCTLCVCVWFCCVRVCFSPFLFLPAFFNCCKFCACVCVVWVVSINASSLLQTMCVCVGECVLVYV